MINLDSIVTWMLFPKKGGTELTLEHTGVEDERNTLLFQGMEKGWDDNVRIKMGKLFNNQSENAVNKQVTI